MNQSPKDKNWIQMMEDLGELRLFGSLSIKKSRKGAAASAQEVDMLFRIALAKTAVTPGELSQAMGASKTIISRLIDQLTEKELITKQYDREDGRSYSLRITEQGKEELDHLYYYYLSPLYRIKEGLGEEQFTELLRLIREANGILQDFQS